MGVAGEAVEAGGESAAGAAYQVSTVRGVGDPTREMAAGTKVWAT